MGADFTLNNVRDEGGEKVADITIRHSQLKGITVPPDNKNSGQAIAALIAEKANPVADVTYLGGIAADPAKDAGVLSPYKPKNWDKIPADLKDADGNWFTIHSGTLGFFVNKQALGNKPSASSA